MFTCVNKYDGDAYNIYDVSYDEAGEPLFLIFDGARWRRVAAKDFMPSARYGKE